MRPAGRRDHHITKMALGGIRTSAIFVMLQPVKAHRTYFQSMDVDSYRALGVFLNSEKWLKTMKEPGEKGEADMCRAGASNKLKDLISRKLQKGKSLETIADELEESVETVSRLMEEMAVKLQ